MKSLVLEFLLVVCVIGALAQNQKDNKKETTPSTDGSLAFEEIIVESSLSVKKKPSSAARRPIRSVVDLILLPAVAESHRVKRQFGNFGGSSAAANANAHNQFFGPQGFGASASNAQAQSFQSGGPLGSFGASAANSASQGFSTGPKGFSASVGQSGSQVYNLPNGQKLNIAFANGYSVGPDGNPTVANGNSVTFS